MKRSMCLLIVLLLTIANLSGCGYVIDSDIYPDARLPKQAFETGEFNLGKGTLPGGGLPYEMKGTIGVPQESENCPVILIVHGENGAEGAYKGYDYLVGELASYGFLTLSIDVGAQYAAKGAQAASFDTLKNIFEDHINKLKEAVAGGSTSYGIDIAGKGDMTRLALIGSGNSGQAAMVLADQHKDVVKGELLINPTAVIDLQGNYPDVNTGIVIPQFAGDAKAFYAQDVFESMRRYEDRTAWESYAFLYGANENYFNSLISEDDAKTKEGRISREDQEKFLKNYAVDFMAAAFMLQNKPALLMPSEFNKKEYYGLKVMTAFFSSNRRILSGEETGDLHPQNASVSHVTDSKTPDKNNDGYFTTPIKNLDLKLYNVKWDNTEIEENPDAFAISYIPEYDKDFTAYKYISLYMAVNPTNENNDPSTPPTVSIRMKDKNKKEAVVAVNKDSVALGYLAGKIGTPGDYQSWSNATPLGTVFVPLYLFKGVDLKNITNVELVFGKNNKGAIMACELSAVPALNLKEKK